MTQHFFLCGVGRSGTTVFRTGLGQHPQVVYNGMENNIVQDLLKVGWKNCTMESRKFAMVVNQDRYDTIFRQAIEALIWPEPKPDVGSARMAAINPEGEQLDYLRQVFPGSKVICLVRNGVEVVSSRTRYESFASQSFENHCDVWNRARSVVAWGRENPDHFRLFRQEWFYDPERLKTELDRVFDWLGLSASDVTLNHITGTLRHPTDASDAPDGNTVSSQTAASSDSDKPANPTLAQGDFSTVSDQEKKDYFLAKRERWRSWNADQRAVFAQRCGEFMQLLGYEIPWL